MEIPDVRILEMCDTIITTYIDAESTGKRFTDLFAGERVMLAMLFNLPVPEVHHCIVSVVRNHPFGARWGELLFEKLKEEMK